MANRKQRKQKVAKPPELPPEVPEEDIEISDEDVKFVKKNRDYASFVSRLDTKSITKHVTRVADAKEDALESLYERRLQMKPTDEEEDENLLEDDPVDVLPVKTLDGELYYRTLQKTPKDSEGEHVSDKEDGGTDPSMVKLTKPEKRAKIKKMKKEAKKQGKEVAEIEEVKEEAQAKVLDEVRKDLTAEEANEMKKQRLAFLGTELLADPESNIKSLKEMLQISKEGDHDLVVLGLKSLLAVFRDIIPGYRIRLPTEKEQEVMVSKAVKKMRIYESTLLSSYKAYIQKLVSLAEQNMYKRVAIRCLCTLLEAVPHFNFRESLLVAVIKNISLEDDIVRKLCCSAVKSLFTNEGKHGGEATVQAVRMIADLVKIHDCQMHPDSIEVFMSLSFDEDLRKSKSSDEDNKHKNKKFKKRKNSTEPNQLPENERKKTKREIMSRTREEVNAELKAASFAKDIEECRRMQSETLSAVFETFFRILRHTMLQRSEGNSPGASGSHPLLAPCLDGIGKFSHLIDLDFMADLMNYLRKLAGGGSNLSGSSKNVSGHLTLSERLRCCIVAFKVMRNNLDALNVDLQEFFVQFYSLILEYRPGRDQGHVLAEAMKIMLCDDRQHDMQRAAAFIKRLATFSLCFGSAEAMAALVTVKHLLQKNVKCRNLLENDAGDGSVSGSIAKYQPYATDPNLSGALASVLWELNLLTKHYHPAVSTVASGLSTMSTANNQVYKSHVSPVQAFTQLLHEHESFTAEPDTKVPSNKRKRGSDSKVSLNAESSLDLVNQTNETEVRKKLSEHYVLLRDIRENKRLKSELDRTTLALQLYEQYKKQKKRKGK